MTQIMESKPQVRLTWKSFIDSLGITKKMLWRVLNQYPDLEVDRNEKYRKAPTPGQAAAVAGKLLDEKRAEIQDLTDQAAWIEQYITDLEEMTA